MRESETRFRDYTTAASDWFWETDTEGRYTYLSDRFYEITGDPPGVIIGRTAAETGRVFKRSEGEDDRDDAFAERKPYRNVVSWRIVGDGSKRWIRSSATRTPSSP